MAGYIDGFTAVVEEHLAECASEALGLPVRACREVIRAALPAVLEGMVALGRERGEDALLAAVRSNTLDVWLSEDLLASCAPGSTTTEAAAAFPGLIAHSLFGSRRGALVDTLAAEGRMPPADAAQVLDAVVLTFGAFLRAGIASSGPRGAALVRELEEESTAARRRMTSGVAVAMDAVPADRSEVSTSPPGAVAVSVAADHAPAMGMFPVVRSWPPVGETDTRVDQLAMRVAAAYDSFKRTTVAAARTEPPPLRPYSARGEIRLRWATAAIAMVAVVLCVRADVAPQSAGSGTGLRTTSRGAPGDQASASPLRATGPGAHPVYSLRLLCPAEQAPRCADITRLAAAKAGIEIGVIPAAHLLGDLEWMSRRGDDGEHHAADLAVARYDALQEMRERARRGDGDAQRLVSTLQIVTPLFTEEVHFFARAGDPMSRIDQIRNKRINVGPYGSSGALTARLIYRQMFGAPIPRESESFFVAEAALRKLVEDRTIDVVVAVGGQPLELVGRLDPALRQKVKLLALDVNDPDSRRALEGYFNATVWPASYPGWLTAKVSTFSVLSFLVTSIPGDAAARAPIDALAASLCTNLGVLRATGHPKWREFQPGLILDTGFAYFAPGGQQFQACADAASKQAGTTPAGTRG
jgi:TRAP-type uncharacterized transport system substrate-binding protein